MLNEHLFYCLLLFSGFLCSLSAQLFWVSNQWSVNFHPIAVMQNTSGSRYVELYSTGVNAQLESEQAPYLVPNIFCNYDASSAVVAKAQELTRDAKNEGDALRLIYSWIEHNVVYDNARELVVVDEQAVRAYASRGTSPLHWRGEVILKLWEKNMQPIRFFRREMIFLMRFILHRWIR